MRTEDKSMKFKIDRTSRKWDSPTPPCPEAVCSKDGAWYITFSTLKALMAWRRSVDENIVISDYGDGPEIEIYDDYRE